MKTLICIPDIEYNNLSINTEEENNETPICSFTNTTKSVGGDLVGTKTIFLPKC